MKKQKVILIAGDMRSGKSTISKILKESFENSNVSTVVAPPAPKFKIFSFASKLKSIARESFGWDGEKDKKGRILLQRLGTEVGRAYNKDIWVDYFSDELERNRNTVYFVDDWRFLNERDNIDFRGHEGEVMTVRVFRDSNKSVWEKITSYINGLFTKKHASEASLPTNSKFYDLVLENNFESIEELKNSRQFRTLYNNIYKFIIN